MRRLLLLWLLSLVLTLDPVLANTATTPATNTEEDSATVLQAFAQQDAKKSDIVAIDDKTKRLVMFSMGVPLLILLLVTVALGVAMGVYGKPVFLPHMICAGLSLTLAIAHAVVGIVWFYPF